jgi:hypothetical protein
MLASAISQEEALTCPPVVRMRLTLLVRVVEHRVDDSFDDSIDRSWCEACAGTSGTSSGVSCIVDFGHSDLRRGLQVGSSWSTSIVPFLFERVLSNKRFGCAWRCPVGVIGASDAVRRVGENLSKSPDGISRQPGAFRNPCRIVSRWRRQSSWPWWAGSVRSDWMTPRSAQTAAVMSSGVTSARAAPARCARRSNSVERRRSSSTSASGASSPQTGAESPALRTYKEV